MASLIDRNGTYYIQFCMSGKARRVSTGTGILQLAKEKLRQFESSQMRGNDNPLPTKTTIADVVGRYVDHIRTRKTAKSAQTHVYYLRDVFGPICPPLQVTSWRFTTAAKKRPFGSQLAMKGESLYKISARMGNSLAICRRHYAALCPKAYGDAIEFDWKSFMRIAT